jgi:hypothetical protein
MSRQYRPLVGARVRVDHTNGSSTGTLWSVGPNSVWLLVNGAPGEEHDLFISSSSIRAMEAT